MGSYRGSIWGHKGVIDVYRDISGLGLSKIRGTTCASQSQGLSWVEGLGPNGP